jgi:hypothetical protein
VTSNASETLLALWGIARALAKLTGAIAAVVLAVMLGLVVVATIIGFLYGVGVSQVS